MNKIVQNTPKNETANQGYVLAIDYWKGFFPKIKTVGFITLKNLVSGENPNNEYDSQKAKLVKLLVSSLFSYQKVYDSFGIQQDVIVVYNITKEHLMKIGCDFRQEDLVFGECFEEAGQYGVLFSQIKTADLHHQSLVGKVLGSILITIFNHTPGKCHVESKGQKFKIYFLENFMVDQNQQQMQSTLNVPCNSYRLGTNFNNQMHPFIHSLQSELNPKISDEDRAIIERLNESAVDETKTLKNGYFKRGMIRNIFKKYKFN